MTAEQLMKPRYKTLCRYPDSPFRIGQIVEGETYNLLGGTKFHCKDYPGIFKKIQWWEERQPEEMPQYLKIGNIPAVYKTDEWCMTEIGIMMFKILYDDGPIEMSDTFLHQSLPATETEYLTYINKEK